MKNKVAILSLVVAILFGCSPREKASDSPIDYSGYVAAHTMGSISIKDAVVFTFASKIISSEEIGSKADSKLMRIRPSVKGSLVWKDERTIEFRPEDTFKGDTEYEVSVALNRVIENIPKEKRTYTFSLRTIKQAMEVRINGLEFYGDETRKDRRISGTVLTADYVDTKSITETVTAKQSGNDLEITWVSTADGRTHNFWIEGVEQNNETEKVLINSTGVPISVHQIGFEAVEVPPKGVFRVLSHNVVQSPEQYVEIRFSEPVDPSQNLQGLINANGIAESRIITDGNLVRVYPTTRVSGNFNFEISPGIRNIDGQRLNQQTAITVSLQKIKPQIKIVGNGVILPSSGGLVFPFRAVNLKAVDVSIFKVYEENIAQFLQASNLDGSNELGRVGRLLLKKTVMLDQTGQTDFTKWNTYNIDLSELIKTEPGAIYRVTLSIRLEHSTYICNGDDKEKPITMIDERYDSNDDIPRTYYYYDDIDYDLYDWRERDNPCHTSYYQRKSVHRNVLASDLGIIAKAGTDGEWLVAVTDLNSAQPISGVNIELLNFQQQVIASASTDNNGFATFNLTEQQVPFLAIAKSGDQRGYLKLDQGSNLSFSAFDVSGAAIQKGLKGFMYGERGVWRPGDTLFVSFILEDKGKTLPANHPVSFELINSRGQLIHRKVANTSVSGMYSFPVPTSNDAPTGNYNARVQVGGVTFNQTFKVEAIMPNRLKINIDFDNQELHYGRVSPATISSAWLHGAPARNLKVQIDATLSQATTTFEGFKGFSFDDPARSFYAEEQTVFEGRLDEQGEISFSPDINVKSTAPGKLNAHFTARVFEEGGAFSIDRFTMPYYPYRNFVGIKMPDSQNRRNTYMTDTTQRVEVVMVTSEGKPLSNKAVNIEVYKIDWRWWWERSNENLSQYISNSHHRTLQRGIVKTDANGKATYDLRINHPEWGRFLIRAVDSEGGHAAGTIAYFDWPGWVSRDRKTTPEAASMLVLATDKEKYDVGDKATVTIPSPAGGKIFLTIENGVKVLQSNWIDAKPGETQYSFTTSASMAPNVFISAMLVQPHGQTANDLPIRMYGIANIGVENPQTHLTPVISMPDVIEPEQKVTISVTEKDGNPMAFTLALVDDGLLDLTRFRTPNPWGNFYAREALGVRTWDLYDLVLGASAGQMQRIIAIGGDGESSSEGDKTANRFKPVVKYFGPCQVDKGGREKITFTMPNYVGSVRVMAVAAKDGAYGSAEKTVPVRKPLMVLATLPRVLGPEEEVMLPVTIFAMDPSVKKVSVRVESNDRLTLDGQNQQTINFDKIGDQVVRFKMRAASRLGVAKIKVTAESGKEKASHEIELDVRNPNAPMTHIQDTVLNANQIWSVQYKAFGMEGTNTALVELSTLPPINLGNRLKYLLGYPHGCLEQTVSKAFPQLFISKLADVDDKVKRSAEENVRNALDRMRSFRTADGGLSLWPGGSYADEWGTAYAGHFMLEAQRLGYSIPSGILDGLKRSTKRTAQNWSPVNRDRYRNNDLMQAYRLYVLALAKAPEMGAMNRLRESADLSVSAKWRLAAAYSLAGNPEAAKSLIQGAPTTIENYREQYYTYGSDIRDRAMIVETLILLNDFDKAMPLLQQLSNRLSSTMWMSTQELSFSLLAFSKFAEANKTSEGVDANIAIHNQSSKRHSTNMSILQHAFEPVQRGTAKVEVKNNGEGMLYARLITHGIPVGGEEIAQSNNLQVDISYHHMGGQKIGPESLTQGTDFYADIRVYNPGTKGNLEQLILAYVVPSGWEIRTSRLDEGQSAQPSSPFEYQDIRDDRVYTYFSLPQGQAKNFRIMLNAAYQGKYYMPGISCEAMYDNTINARQKGNWVEVVLP